MPAMALMLALLAAPALADASGDFSETIVVTGRGAPAGEASLETRHSLDAAAIAPLDAASADEILRRLPAAAVPVNSRGEAIAFLRNAAERQVAVFYDGADINVPWDNRLDLSFIPAGLIGSARNAAGPLAPHYGVNALGALSLSPGTSFHGGLSYGTGERFDGDLAVPLGPVVVGGSYSRRDGDPLSSDASLPYSQADRSLRTNTDRELASAFGRAAGTVGAHTLSLTAFHIWGSKGIAPESHLKSGARYWRYPDMQHTLIVGNVQSRLGDSTELISTIWYQRFGQTIDSYEDVSYDRVASHQEDRDRTWGVRELLQHRAGRALVVGSFNFLQSTHWQRDVGYRNGAPPAALPGALIYRQRNWSVGGEFEYELTEQFRSEIGIGYDVVNYLRTGDKPPVEDAKGWTGRAGLVFEAGSGLRLRGAVGRKMRSPTMRERFGEGIGRFLPNPDLKPETIVTAELAAEWRGEKGGFYVIPFIQDLKDTIDQRTVSGKRQRINLQGSKAHGVEIGGEVRPVSHLTLAGSATWTHVRRKGATGGVLNRIPEKPALIANMSARYAHPSGFSTTVEGQHYGRAYSAGPDGGLLPLKRSISLNWRLSHRFGIEDNRIEPFLHIENITDAVIEPQLGLPAPGRSLRIGLRIG